VNLRKDHYRESAARTVASRRAAAERTRGPRVSRRWGHRAVPRGVGFAPLKSRYL
jgi:hypothetical protein